VGSKGIDFMPDRVVPFAAASVASLLATEAVAQTKRAVLAAAAPTAASVEEPVVTSFSPFGLGGRFLYGGSSIQW